MPRTPLSPRKKLRIEKNLLRSRSYKRLIYSRIFVTVALVLAQIALWAYIIFGFYHWSSQAVLVLAWILGLVCVTVVINTEEKPSTKLNWMLIILIVPFAGVPLYFLFGNGKPTRRMHRQIAAEKSKNMSLLQTAQTALPSACNGAQQAEKVSLKTSAYLSLAAGYPAYAEDGVKYYSSGDALFQAMLESIRAAKKYILAEYFILAGGKMWDEFKSALVKKAEEGVQIRIIFDDFGCIGTMPPKFDRYLESLHENIRCFTFNPVVPVLALKMNNRDHRKFLVVDGVAAFTGGINVADEYIGKRIRFGHWKDAGVKLTGQSVRTFVVMFFNLWNAFYPQTEDVAAYLPPPCDKNSPTPCKDSGCLVQPYDDSPLDKESVAETVYADIIMRAEKYAYIFTPYLILDDFMRSALCIAAKRGVDVRIVTPGIPDKKTVFRLTRANYAPLIKAGVKIYEYTPGFVHSKVMLSDDKTAVVGTVNLDYRSLYLHFENAVYFTCPEPCLAVKKDFEETFPLCMPIEKTTLKRGYFGRLADSIIRIFETLF